LFSEPKNKVELTKPERKIYKEIEGLAEGEAALETDLERDTEWVEEGDGVGGKRRKARWLFFILTSYGTVSSEVQPNGRPMVRSALLASKLLAALVEVEKARIKVATTKIPTDILLL